MSRDVIDKMERVKTLDSELRRRTESITTGAGSELRAELAKINDPRMEQIIKTNYEAALKKRVSEITEEARVEKESLLKSVNDTYESMPTQRDKEMLVLRASAMMGATELSAPYDLHDVAMGTTSMEKLESKITNGAGFFLRHGVSGARKSSAVAAFELAYGKSDQKGGRMDFMKTMDYMTRDIVDDTLYNYDPENRPAWMRTNTGRLLTQFQFFRFQTMGKVIQLTMDAIGRDHAAKIAEAAGDPEKIDAINRERSEARQELAYMTSVSMGLAGAAGAPIAMVFGNTATSLVYNAIAWMFEDPDDPWDLGRDVSTALHDAVGDDVANVFEKGLPSILGVDLSNRLGVGGAAHVVEGEAPEGMSASQRSAWYANKLLGPWWSMLGDWRKAGDAIAEGKLGEAAKDTLPNFVKNFYKAYDLNEQGVTNHAGKSLLKAEDVSMYDVALQMVGINPLDVSLAKEQSKEVANLSATLSARRHLIINQLAEATMKQDVDAKNDAIEKMSNWNTTQPRLAVTAQELASAIKRMKNNQAGGVTKKEAIIADQYGLK